jgi:hypothetical protein
MALNPPLQLKFFDGWGSSTDSPKGTSSKVHRLRDTTEPDGFAEVALKLGEFGKLEPDPIEEWLFFDHPTGRSRIRMAMRWKAAQRSVPTPEPVPLGH